MVPFYSQQNIRVFKSVHVCVTYKCKHWTLVADFPNGNRPLTGSTEYTGRICIPKETQDGSHVSKRNTLLYIETGTANITSLRHAANSNALRAYIFIPAKMCNVFDIFFRLMNFL